MDAYIRGPIEIEHRPDTPYPWRLLNCEGVTCELMTDAELCEALGFKLLDTDEPV